MGSENINKEDIEKIAYKYVNEDYADKLCRSGQYIKVIYKEEFYEGKTIEQIQEEFNNLDIVENK